jgi:glycine/D-amino acid oxidase-like deaminating enzyme
MERFDVVIVGAGIIGSACVRECARAGMRVAVVESALPAAGATAAGMGHVVVMDDSAAQLALTAYSRSLWRSEELPAEVEYVSRGTVWVAADDEEMGEAEAKQRMFAGADVSARVLSAVELRAEEPNLREGLAGGLLVPEDGVSRPPAAAAFFLAEAERLGACVYRSRALRAAEGEVLLEDGRRLQAERIVLAVGNECELLPALPVKKRKGHLVMTERCPGFINHQLVELGYVKSAHEVEVDSVAFNVQPRLTGEMVIGSSRQFGSEDAAVDEAILARMVERAGSYMPGLAGLRTVKTWTGFRAATPDKLPLIGPAKGLSDDSTLWLAAGFEGLGTTNSLAAARLLVDGMLGRESAIDAAPYLPERMAGLEERR